MTFARSLAFLTYIIPRSIEVGAEAASAAFLFPRHRRRIVGIALEKEETARRRRRGVGFGGRGREREREKTAILRYPRLLHPLPLPRYLLDSRVVQKQPRSGNRVINIAYLKMIHLVALTSKVIFSAAFCPAFPATASLARSHSALFMKTD